MIMSRPDHPLPCARYASLPVHSHVHRASVSSSRRAARYSRTKPRPADSSSKWRYCIRSASVRCWCMAGAAARQPAGHVGYRTPRGERGAASPTRNRSMSPPWALNGPSTRAFCHLPRASDIEAIGLSGVDAGLIRARKRPPVPVSRDPAKPWTMDRGRHRYRELSVLSSCWTTDSCPS